MIFNRCSKDFVHKTKQKKNRENYISVWVVILVPFTLQKKVVRTIFFFLPFTRVTIRLGLWLKHARNHHKARQSHMNMVRNEDAFTQSFRTAKGVQTSFFFFGFGAIENRKKASPDPFHENMVRNVYTAKMSGPYQLFYGFGPIFFCSVNRALVSHTSCFQTILFEIIRKKEPWKYMDKVTDLQV